MTDATAEQPVSAEAKAEQMNDLALRVITHTFNSWLQRGLPADVISSAAASAGLTLMANMLTHEEMVGELRAIAERLDQLDRTNVAGHA
jgi:hypothetical protein